MAIERPLEPAEPLLLPTSPPRFGPITRRLLARFVVGVALVQALAAVLVFGVGTRSAVAAGTSLVFPGAGFVYVAWPLLFLLTLVLAAVAVVVWWGASAHLAIPLVWLGGAVGSALLAGGPRLVVESGTTWDWAVPFAYVLALGSVGLAVARLERAHRSKRAVVAELNAYLSALPATEDGPIEPPLVRDPDAMDVELLRWAYAVANQPDDDLVGLDWGEQFHSGTQLRYQLNGLCWGLSLYAANFVPNAQAQAEAALARLIEKHTDLRVWRYWRTLNLLGNFDANPDPIRRDNIMFSAFLGDVLNVYEAATGSDRFDQPGSLTFVWSDGRTFEYDHHSIAAAVEANFQRSRLGFFSCEPGWSFSVCNVMGAQSLFGHDTLHGSSTWQRVGPRWVQTLDEEYAAPDGSYAHIKSSLVGLAWDTGEVPGGHYLAAGSNRFADILPAHARRAAALERRKADEKIRGVAAMVRDGRLDLELPATLERHRARKSALAAWNGLIGGARLVGERELVLAALDASARQCGTGRRWPERPLDASVPGLTGHMMLRWSMPLTSAELNVRGYVPPVGPLLVDAPWDDVLVTEARSPDGESLVLRLEPAADSTWPASADEVSLGFDHLEPGARYELAVEPRSEGVEVVADAAGAATVSIRLHASARLLLRRAAS